MIEPIQLTEKETEIIWRATKHRKKILGFGLPFREMLAHILQEYDEELDMVEKELRAEGENINTKQSHETKTK